MGLLSGLEKFGLKVSKDIDIFEDEQENQRGKGGENGDTVKVTEIPPEESLILEKSVTCPICDRVFRTKMVKSGRVKRLESDRDLRPRHQYIDTLKYDVCSCPECGYTALHRYFPNLTRIQKKMLEEEVCATFRPPTEKEPAVYDYDIAIERCKLSLFNTIAKKGKVSEKAYTCLKIAWLYRGKAETMESDTEAKELLIQQCKKEEEEFYRQAYEGLVKAVSTEMFPICGMDQGTVDFLLAAMSVHYKKYDVASKLLASILTSQTAGRQMKNRALAMKEEVVAELRKGKKLGEKSE
ncbi:MAG: DUF2225 domain-containing protein [Lachnospiraceae bacterium]|nr:DUF2225 domain-containing protein [Lachnospiraceae bacterium]